MGRHRSMANIPESGQPDVARYMVHGAAMAQSPIFAIHFRNSLNYLA
jgi:hypothetical protein